MRIVSLVAIFAGTCLAQVTGMVETHVHGDPDSAARSLDVIDIVRQAKDAGMRAVLLKNHYSSTVGQAFLTHRVVPGIEVFGGLVLNRSVGGLNPAAVEAEAKIHGGFMKVVWMPTFDSGNEANAPNRPYVPVSKNGQLLSQVLEVLKVMAKYNLALATGHSQGAEHVMLVHAAKKAGISRIVCTHPTGVMSIDQMKEAAADGAYIEFVYHSLLGNSPRRPTIARYVQEMKAVGPEHCIISSDLGQADSPLPVAGWKTYIEELKNAGMTAGEIDLMARRNPARFLGLE